MSVNVPNTFIRLFTSMVKKDFQQKGSVLRGSVGRLRNLTNAEDANFHRIGTATVTQRVRHGVIPAHDIAHSQVTIGVEDWYSRLLIDDADRLKTNINLQREYSEAIGMALGRQLDDIIVSALGATTNTGTLQGFTGLGANTLTKQALLRMQAVVKNAQVPQSELVWVISPDVTAALLDINEVTNIDFVQTKPLPEGQLPPRFLGFRWVESTRLPTAAGGAGPTGQQVTTYLVHRESFGVLMQRDIRVKVERLPDRDGDQVLGVLTAGAGIIDPAGVYEIVIDV